MNIQHRFNAALGREAPYYRLKESYRDVRGRVHSLILLNVGFEPELDALEMRRIAKALTARFERRRECPIFGENLSCLTDKERAAAGGGARCMTMPLLRD